MTRLVAWRGVLLEEMTREELILALRECSAELEEYRRPEVHRAFGLARVAEFRDRVARGR